MNRLANATLAQVPATVGAPAYDRAATSIGVVHFGPGAFHRAHQAWYVDRMLADDPGMAICAVSLRTADLRDALDPQNGLYVLVEQASPPRMQVVGSIREILVAADRPEAVFSRLMTTRYVTATITEKGYALTPTGDLDLTHPDVRRDLETPTSPVTLTGWLTEALRRRKTAGLPPFTTMSCDNLSDNGAKLRRAVVRFAEARGDAALARWIAAEAAFPSSMVDSITPATDASLRDQVAETLGIIDAWPVQRERFVQWVVEDRLGADTAMFARAGVTFARSVAPFERAKLRLLNGAHSTLAYVGLGLGHQTVSAAMADRRLAGFVERMMRQDVAPTLAGSELDVDAYIDAILDRFRDPAIVHRLSQIAWDGSQKLRFRLLETMTDALAARRPIIRLATGVAAWIHFVVTQARSGADLVDPLRESLIGEGLRCDGSPDDVGRFLGMREVFPQALAIDPEVRNTIASAYKSLQVGSAQVLDT